MQLVKELLHKFPPIVDEGKRFIGIGEGNKEIKKEYDMKTRFLTCLAALLLTSACAFAQSIIEGDVNDDGIVDIADVVSVAAIKKAGTAVVAKSVTLNNASLQVYIGKTDSLTATVLPAYAADKTVTWTSSNTSVATVTQEGVVTGVAEGTATITATTANGKTATCAVTVSKVTYYWYVGTTKPTSLSQCEQVTTYESEILYTNNSGSKSHIFVLTNSDKNVTFIEPNFNAPITQVDVDTTTISGYNIFETAVGVANTGSIKIRIS